MQRRLRVFSHAFYWKPVPAVPAILYAFVEVARVTSKLYSRCKRNGTSLVGDEGVMAFTDFGIENLIDLVRVRKGDPTLLKRGDGAK